MTKSPSRLGWTLSIIMIGEGAGQRYHGVRMSAPLDDLRKVAHLPLLGAGELGAERGDPAGV